MGRAFAGGDGAESDVARAGLYGAGLMRWVALAMCVAGVPASAATVLVEVGGVPDGRGHVLVAICPKADFLKPVCPWRGKAAAALGMVRVRVENVPPGVYAAEAFQDRNDNGVLDRNFFGMPKEAMGFSKDAPMRFGPPDFGAAAFVVRDGNVRIGFSLRSY